MKHLFFIALLLTATLTYAQGLLPEEKIRKEPPAQPVQQPAKQPVHQTKKYDWKGEYYEGLAKVKLNDKYGFIDKTGKEVIPIKYDHAYGFSIGLALVKLEGKWFYINPKGECVKDCNNAPSDHPIAK